jgi:hypothetical protein
LRFFTDVIGKLEQERNEMLQKIDSLEAQLRGVKDENVDLKKRVASLETRVDGLKGSRARLLAGQAACCLRQTIVAKAKSAMKPDERKMFHQTNGRPDWDHEVRVIKLYNYAKSLPLVQKEMETMFDIIQPLAIQVDAWVISYDDVAAFVDKSVQRTGAKRVPDGHPTTMANGQDFKMSQDLLAELNPGAGAAADLETRTACAVAQVLGALTVSPLLFDVQTMNRAFLP